MIYSTGENTPNLITVNPVQGGGNNGNAGFGGDWASFIVLFLIFAIFGWGGYGGFGGMGGNGVNGALTRADLCQDMNFGQVENSIRGIQQGICDSTFALNNSITTGFHGVDNAICNLGYTLQGQFNSTNTAFMQGFNSLQALIAQCCCDNRVGQMEINNNIDKNFCNTNYNAATNTTAIIQNAHNDTDRILARLDAIESNRKDEVIADLRTKLAACGDQSTAQYVINSLTRVINPTPVPAYPAASPCGLGNWAPQVLANACGCNNQCGGCC